MITHFLGEERRDAIASHFSLDIVEEDSFFDFLDEMGYSENDDDDIIESMYALWHEKWQYN